MSANGLDFTIGIGGAAGQGIATPGNILARIFARRGLHLYSYNAHQSIIRGGHSLLMLRIRDEEVHSHGDGMNLLLCLNQDTMNRHVGLLGPGSRVLYNSDKVEPEALANGVLPCPMPIGELAGDSKNKLIQNTISLGVMMSLMGMDFSVLEEALELLFKRKGAAVVEENVTMAKAGFDHGAANFEPYPVPIPQGDQPLAIWAGNDAMAMGGAAAGVKFYAAYPMSPATGVLHWMANNSHELGIMVRQVEDEIGVAQHDHRRRPRRLPRHVRHLRRRLRADVGIGRERGDDGDPRGLHQRDARRTLDGRAHEDGTGGPSGRSSAPARATSSASSWRRRTASTRTTPWPSSSTWWDRAQCPGIIVSDLLLSEGTFTVDPNHIEFQPEIDRGVLLVDPSPNGNYLRYADTESGISPRVVPGYEGFVHVVCDGRAR